MKRSIDVGKLLDIGIALSKEKDNDALLETIVTGAMDITNCDGGTLYIKKEDTLVFSIMVTRSMQVFKGGRNGSIELPPVPLSRQNVCACAVLERKLINIPDVYSSEQFDFSGPRRYDAMTGYKTTSQMVVPMEDDYGDIIGVLQLINAQDEQGKTIPFDEDYAQVVLSLASQAAICLTNRNLSAEITELLHSFVRVMSTAIDARSPYNANHTRNMVRYGERFLNWLQNFGGNLAFSDTERDQLLMSIWLHDVGKLVVPLEVMDKETRLGSRLPSVLHRFEVASLTNQIAMLNESITQDVYNARADFLSSAQELVKRSNSAGFLPDEDLERIQALAAETYTDADGSLQSFLNADDLVCLSVRRGTLTGNERQIMESHVEMTKRMLDEMTFSRNYRDVPEWASAHHEFLDGSGYPLHLKSSDIPRSVRLLTILDIFDALTARDRPYKPAMPVERALSILDSMATEGKLDSDILGLFKQSQAWLDS